MRVTRRQYRELENKLKSVNSSLQSALESQREAQALGDLSENEEYTTARAEAERLMVEKHRIESIINDAEIEVDRNSSRITLGCTVDVCKVSANGEEIGKVRRFRLELNGDTITQQVLGANSPLGMAILNGADGIYTVQNNDGIHYRVRRVQNEGEDF